MTTPADIVRSFYAAIARGDAPAALGLMSPNIEWNTMWHYKVADRGPQAVAEGLLQPLLAEWSSFALNPAEFIVQGDTVVSLGRFTGTHGTTGKHTDAAYAHVWDIEGERIGRFRQYIDTKAVAEARH